MYLITAIGVPVYLHYCGGELEKVNYVIKSNGCCGDEEDADDMGCCKDESLVARYSPDFTAKKINVGVNFILPSIDLIYSELFQNSTQSENNKVSLAEFLFPPPELIQENIVSTSNLRI